MDRQKDGWRLRYNTSHNGRIKKDKKSGVEKIYSIKLLARMIKHDYLFG